MATALAVLIAYHVLFYWKAYFRPFDLARSELLSTFFPSWIHLGRGEIKHDRYYWGNYRAHPVLSPYYPAHRVLARVAMGFQSLDSRFRLLVLHNSLHALFSSIGWYLLINLWGSTCVALFGSITLTYSAYNIKQQPCTLYTIGWFPWIILGIVTKTLWLSSLSFGMVLLSGYYPLGIQCFLMALLATLFTTPLDFLWIVYGTVIGLPQLIPFIRYIPNTIRVNAHDNIGRVSWWNIMVELLCPQRLSLSGVGYWEMAFYTGITPIVLCLLYPSTMLLLLSIIILLMMGLFSSFLPRIPARWSYSFQVILGLSAMAGLRQANLPRSVVLALCVLQALDLFVHNSPLLITHPYSELPNRPSFAFNTKLTRYFGKHRDGKVSGLPYPLFTGHINQIRGLGYCGGMQTKEMAKLRGDDNPNGSGFHDWFRLREDGSDLDVYGIKWAYRRKRPAGWIATPIRFLWENPRIN